VQGYVISGDSDGYFYNNLADNSFAYFLQAAELKAWGHRAAQWTVNNGTGLGQWVLFSIFSSGGSPNWGRSDPGAHATVFAKLDGSPPRILAHHYANTGTSYFHQPHSTISADGRVAMWASNMGNAAAGGGRVDLFLAVVPAR